MKTGSDFVRRTALPIVLLALAVAAVYYRTLGYGFVYDDNEQILGNRWILSFANMPEVFSTHSFGFKGEGYQAISYRPIFFVVYMAEYAAFGFSAWGWHMVNVATHFVNSALVFLVLRHILESENREYSAVMPAFAGALIFSVHPMNAEPVSWLASMVELAFTFFCLAAFYVEARRTDGKAGAPSWFSASRMAPPLFFLAALLLKETAVALPVIVIAYQAARRGFRSLPSAAGVSRYLPYAVAAAAYAVMRVNALKGDVTPSATLHDYLTPYEFILNAFVLLARYFKALALPFGEPPLQLMDPVFSVTEPRAFFSVIVAVLVPVALAVVLKRITRLWVLVLAVIILPILPTLYSPAISRFPFADRYLYFPSAGFAMLLSIVLAWAGLRASWGRAAIVAVLVAALPFAAYARQKSAPWESDLTLWSAALASQPSNYVALHSVGAVRLKEGRFDEAVDMLEKALDGNLSSAHPDESMVILTRKTLALATLKAGMMDASEEHHEAYLALVPEDAEYLYNLAVLKQRRGAPADALAYFERAVLFSRDAALSKMARVGASECLLELGRRGEAFSVLSDALREAPGDPGILAKVRALESGL